MPKVGDRVVIEGTKVGAVRREGRFLGATGRLIRVGWADGSESLMSPGAGSIRFEPGGNGGAKGGRPVKAPAKPKAAVKAKAPAKSRSKGAPAAKPKSSKAAPKAKGTKKR